MIRKFELLSCLCLLLLAMAMGFIPAGSTARPQQDQTQPDQNQPQPQQDQSQPGQDQPKKKSKKGGFFKGLKAITGQSTEQTQETSTAGTKSVGEGAKIGSVTPTDADRQQLSAMESYTLTDIDMKRFQKDGHLQPKQ